MERPVAFAGKSLLVGTVRVGREQHAAWLQRRAKLGEDARQLLTGHVEQRSIGKNPIELCVREREVEEILAQHFAAAQRASHLDEAQRPLDPDGFVPQ